MTCGISETALVLFIGAAIYLLAALWYEASATVRRWWNRRKRHE